MSSRPAEIRTRPSVMPSACALVGRHRGVGHRGRMRDERFDAAEAFGERHQPDAVQQPPGRLERSEVERQHAAEAAHLACWRARAAGERAGPGSRRAGPWGGRRGTRRARGRSRCAALIRSGSVLVPRSTSHESNGTQNRAGGVLHELQPLDVVVARRRSRCRRRCRCGRSDTSSCCA